MNGTENKLFIDRTFRQKKSLSTDVMQQFVFICTLCEKETVIKEEVKNWK